MRCPTMEVNIDGQKVIINVADFNADIMAVWVDYNPETVIQTEQLYVPEKSSEALSPVLHASRLVPPPPPPPMKTYNGV